MTLTLDADTFVETLKDIVEERGRNFVYASMTPLTHPSGLGCSYVTSDNETPCRCLIGEIAHRHGVSDEEMRERWDGTGTVDMLVGEGYIHATEDTLYLMSLAQNAQDIGTRYGFILDEVLAHWDGHSNGSSS